MADGTLDTTKPHQSTSPPALRHRRTLLVVTAITGVLIVAGTIYDAVREIGRAWWLTTLGLVIILQVAALSVDPICDAVKRKLTHRPRQPSTPRPDIYSKRTTE